MNQKKLTKTDIMISNFHHGLYFSAVNELGGPVIPGNHRLLPPCSQKKHQSGNQTIQENSIRGGRLTIGVLLTPVLLNCLNCIFRHLKLELLTQFPASNDKKYFYFLKIYIFLIELLD